MKKRIFLVLIIIVTIFNSFGTNSLAQSDNHQWYIEYVEELQKRNIFSVFEHENFEPDRIVTRQDIIKMIIMSQDYKDSLGNPTSNLNSTYNSYVNLTNRAVEMGIIERQQVLSIFNPYDFISREEAVELIIKALDYFVDAPTSNTVNTLFMDSYDVSHSRIPYFNRAISIGMIKGYSDNTFRPKNYITMSEAAAMIWRIIDNIEKHFFNIENSIYLNKNNKLINISINDDINSIEKKFENPSWEHDDGPIKWRTYLLNEKDLVLMAIRNGKVVYLYSNSRNWKDSNGANSGMESGDLLQTVGREITDNVITMSNEDILVNYYIDYQHISRVSSIEIYERTFYHSLYSGKNMGYFSKTYEDITFLVINSFRHREGLEELSRDKQIDKIAQDYSEIRGLYPQSSFIWELQGGAVQALNNNNISYWGAGESIKQGRYMPVGAVESWLYNTNDRMLILNRSFSRGGIGVYINQEGSIYYSLIQVIPPLEH